MISVICHSHFRSLSNHTPRNLVSFSIGIVLPDNVRLMFTFLHMLSLNIKQTDFSTFSVSLFALNQSCSTCRSRSVIFLSPSGLGWPRYRVVSSTN